VKEDGMISYPTYTDVCATIYVWIFMLDSSASHILKNCAPETAFISTKQEE